MYTRIAFAAIVTCCGVARAEEPFADTTLTQAKADAKEKDRVIMIDFYTTWCGPCKKLDQSTWKDADVRKWLGRHVIALKLDAEKHVKTASKYKVNAYPTILFIKPNGEEIDRIVGYKAPSEFLSEARDLLAGKDSVTRARDKAKGDKENDPMARMQVARALENKGKQKEALEEYLWCFDHGLEHGQGFHGVRLSFLLGDITRLGQNYPPAIEALKERRDNARKAILSGKGSVNAPQDFQALCRELGEPGAALELYDELAKKDDDNAQESRKALGRLVFEPLLKARRYKDALEASGGGAKAVDQAFEHYEMTKSSPLMKKHRKEMLAYHKRTILQTGGQVYEALLGASKPKSARKLADRLLKFDGADSTYETLIRHANRAKAAEAVIKLRKLQEQAEKQDDSNTGDEETKP